MQHAQHAVNPWQALQFGFVDVAFELHVDLFDGQRTPLGDHAAGHVGNGRAGAGPTVVLIPFATVGVGDFDLTLVPQRL